MMTKAILVSTILLVSACDNDAQKETSAPREDTDTRGIDSHDTGTDTDTDADSDADGDADTDVDSDVDSDSEPDTDTRGVLCVEYCETWDQINDALECQYPCYCESKCEDLWALWLLCVLKAPREQCHCMPDGRLNCEGSYDDDEGAALCIEEYISFYDCSTADGSDLPVIVEDTEIVVEYGRLDEAVREEQ